MKGVGKLAKGLKSLFKGVKKLAVKVAAKIAAKAGFKFFTAVLRTRADGSG